MFRIYDLLFYLDSSWFFHIHLWMHNFQHRDYEEYKVAKGKR